MSLAAGLPRSQPDPEEGSGSGGVATPKEPKMRTKTRQYRLHVTDLLEYVGPGSDLRTSLYVLVLDPGLPIQAPVVTDRGEVLVHPTTAALLGWISEEEEDRWLTR